MLNDFPIAGFTEGASYRGDFTLNSHMHFIGVLTTPSTPFLVFCSLLSLLLQAPLSLFSGAAEQVRQTQ